VEQHVWEVARSPASGIGHRVLTASRSRRRVVDAADGVVLVRAPEFGRVASVPLTPTWPRELRRSGASVVHVHLPNPLGEAAVLAWPDRPPVIASYHADVVRSPALARAHRRLQDRFLARTHAVVVGSPTLAATSPVLARHRDRVVVVPYGVDPAEWPPDPGASERLRPAGGRRLVLFLGRLVRYKGVEVLLEAMRAIEGEVAVVGDGPDRPRLEAAIRAHGLGARARVTGHVSNAERAAWYRAADVFVLPAVSRAETFGIAMLEAMASGTPAVCTEVGTGTSWVNRHGETGLVVPPRDPAALAAAVRALLDDEARRREYGAAAAERARLHFSKAAMVGALTDLYRSAGAPGPPGPG
jgi:rhamnosyl/mannosyltransferase